MALEGRKQVKLSRQFHELLWNCVSKGGEIRTTSIVSVDPYWRNPEEYLMIQKKLIYQKGIAIYRYFIWVEDHARELDEHTEVLRSNFASGIRTRVLIYKDRNIGSKFLKDVGLVDNLVAVTNTVSNLTSQQFRPRDITRITAKIDCDRNRAAISQMQTFFSDLELQPNILKSENYNHKYEAFHDGVKDEITRTCV